MSGGETSCETFESRVIGQVVESELRKVGRVCSALQEVPSQSVRGSVSCCRSGEEEREREPEKGRNWWRSVTLLLKLPNELEMVLNSTCLID